MQASFELVFDGSQEHFQEKYQLLGEPLLLTKMLALAATFVPRYKVNINASNLFPFYTRDRFILS